MHVDVLEGSIGIGMPTIFAFLLVLARVAGIFTFLPFPMLRNAPELVRIVLALVLTIALFPFWPAQLPGDPGLGLLVIWILREAFLGLVMGLGVSFLAESITLAAQMMASQAGYSYATSIDPSSDADSGVLPILGQLFASLLFFSLGLDRQVIAAIAASLKSLPPGANWRVFGPESAEPILKLAGGVFKTALELALPIIALLLILDLALALLSRLNPQMQLLSVAFPAKMLLALIVLAGMAPAITAIYESQAARCFATLQSIFVRNP